MIRIRDISLPPQQDMAQGLPQQSGAALQNQCFHEQSSKV